MRYFLFYFLCTISVVSAIPPLPCSFQGNALINNIPAFEGATISGWINGNHYPTDALVSNDGFYEMLVLNGDDLSTPDSVEGGRNGDTVQFRLNCDWGEFQFAETRIWTEGYFLPTNLTTEVDSLVIIHFSESCWKLVSLPLTNWEPSETFPAGMFCWAFDGTAYVRPATVNWYNGLWLRSFGAEKFAFVTSGTEQRQVSVQQGWQLVGIPVTKIKMQDIRTFPSNKIEYIYSFSGTYISLNPNDYLRSGNGYWMKFSEDCTLIFGN